MEKELEAPFARCRMSRALITIVAPTDRRLIACDKTFRRANECHCHFARRPPEPCGTPAVETLSNGLSLVNDP